ncbi:MAG: hypothetical protein ACM3N9_01715 [Syntrophothermus sp.]
MGKHYTTDCSNCHRSASQLRFEPVGVNCYDCHQKDYQATTHPSHVQGNFSTDCILCHSMTGTTWVTTNVDHSFFPLTQGHKLDDCSRCHTSGNFSGLTSNCVSCHLANYNGSRNPDHVAASIPQTCSDCHTTVPGWKPATFSIHNNYWVITGAHSAFANDCNRCHSGGYSNTPGTCEGCHMDTYNQTSDPNHVTAQFGTDCQSCHSQNAWKPSTFNHDGAYFPVYSGKHAGTWNLCSDCHTNASNYKQFTCVDCHDHNQPKTDAEHVQVGGYSFSSPACFACHPTGTADGAFNHNNSIFPLTGGHSTVECLNCHANGYPGTPTVCSACHMNNFNQSVNPNHAQINIPTTCESCHTTNPGWKPATFPIHNNYWQLTGAHVSTSCDNCHHNNYNSTPTTCFGCHQGTYNQTVNPPHLSAQFPTACETCHNTTTWVPSTFNHDGQYFPIYSGKHAGKWNLCSDCHNNPSNYQVFTCLTCHQQPEMDDKHQGVPGYAYSSPACFNCHPNGNSPNRSLKMQRNINHN